MSITSDIRSYADIALEQGKQVLDQAQTQLTDVTVQANGLVGKLTDTAKGNVSEMTAKATEAVSDLRTQAEKNANLKAIKAAFEPYITQAKGYSNSVSDRAEELYATIKNDKRVGKLVSTTESLTGVVVESVHVHVVKPVQSLTGRSTKPAAKAPAAPKTAATRPATTVTTTPDTTPTTTVTTTPATAAAAKATPRKGTTTTRTTPAKKADAKA